MFDNTMSVAEMDAVISQKYYKEGYLYRDIVKDLTDTELKYYDRKFKQENNIENELSYDDMKLLSSIGDVILQEKLRRDRKAVFNNESWQL